MRTLLRIARGIAGTIARTFVVPPRIGSRLIHGAHFVDVIPWHTRVREAETLRHMERDRLAKDDERRYDLAP
ncbi:MAG: hypothetical protein IT304_06595 [Dehalococcoidia bacterium]|nr:hypothetical protein [Dehalococcoidia bacterium]